MSDRTENSHAFKIDTSSVETFRSSTAQAARELRVDAAKKEAEAADLRRQAAEWIEKEVPSAAQPLLAEAGRLEDTARERHAAAAAYESV